MRTENDILSVCSRIFCSCGLTINSLGYGAAIVVVSLIGQVKIYVGFQNLVLFS